jgi:hypothetical protein
MNRLETMRFYLRDLLFLFTNAPVIHCLGDSHLNSFEYLAGTMMLKNTRFRFCKVPGATLMGIPNKYSNTRARHIFNDYLQRVASSAFILTCLGEVDCGFVIWFRSKKYQVGVETQYKRALGNYLDYLMELKNEGRHKLIVSSIPLPTLPAGVMVRKSEERREINVTQRERTDITMRYNRDLRIFCSQQRLFFLDLEQHTLDQASRLVDPRFLNPEKADYHMHKPAVANVIAIEMRQLGFS